MNAPRTAASVIQTPACISDLEDRIQSNVTFSPTFVRGQRLWMVEANCTRRAGFGRTLSAAVLDFLRNMGLEAR